MTLKKTHTIYLYVLTKAFAKFSVKHFSYPFVLLLFFFILFVIIIIIGITTEKKVLENTKERADCDIPIQAVTILERNKPYIAVLMEEITKIIVDGSTYYAFDNNSK